MLRSMVGKVVRRTPGLRRLVRGRGGDQAPTPAPSPGAVPSTTPPAGASFGAEQPGPVKAQPQPAVQPEPAEEPAPAKKATAKKATAKKATAKKATAKKASTKKASTKKATAKKGTAKKATAKKATATGASTQADKQTEGGRDSEEVERLRQEAEKRKAEIRARKEAEAKAAEEAKPAAGGIAALIASTGGKVDELESSAGVRATSGIDWVPEDTDVHLAEDGEEYWGAIDNESSRSFARGETLIIDQWECINCGTCVENTEHVFVLPGQEKAVVVSQEGPMDLIQDAIDACPVTCIHWTDDPDQFEQINDAEGNPLS